MNNGKYDKQNNWKQKYIAHVLYVKKNNKKYEIK